MKNQKQLETILYSSVGVAVLLAIALAFIFWYLISIQVSQSTTSFPSQRQSRATGL